MYASLVLNTALINRVHQKGVASTYFRSQTFRESRMIHRNICAMGGGQKEWHNITQIMSAKIKIKMITAQQTVKTFSLCVFRFPAQLRGREKMNIKKLRETNEKGRVKGGTPKCRDMISQNCLIGKQSCNLNLHKSAIHNESFSLLQPACTVLLNLLACST
jgi:hypothetical protein